MTVQMIMAIAIFAGAYAVIMTDKFPRTSVFLIAASLIIIFKIIPTQEIAFAYLDLNTIFLLISMMILVAVVKRSGFFQFLAIESVRLVGKNPKVILFTLSTVVAITSSVLDNVTTVLLTIPITLAIAETLELDPLPFVMAEIMNSNIGGAATAIGDPPNMIVASQSGLSFLDFIMNVSPVAIITFFSVNLLILILYRKKLVLSPGIEKKKLHFHPSEAITSRKMLLKSVLVLSFAIFMFTIHHRLDIELATIALGSAAFLTAITDIKFLEVLKDVDLDTILFLVGLFILVGGLQSSGVVKKLAELIVTASGGNYFMTATLILWMSAFSAAFIGAVPYTVMMVPVIASLPQLNTVVFSDIKPLWWTLSLGASLGGNGTIIGALANIVAIGTFFRYTGRKITFKEFLKVGMPIIIVSIVISNIYVYMRYMI